MCMKYIIHYTNFQKKSTPNCENSHTNNMQQHYSTRLFCAWFVFGVLVFVFYLCFGSISQVFRPDGRPWQSTTNQWRFGYPKSDLFIFHPKSLFNLHFLKLHYSTAFSKQENTGLRFKVLSYMISWLSQYFWFPT